MDTIKDLKDILANEERRMQIIKDELKDMKAKYGDERRSRIEYSASEMRMEDLIADEEVVITISHAGYIKRTNLAEYKVQNRGGMGSKGSATREKDFLEHLFVATNHNYLLIFHLVFVLISIQYFYNLRCFQYFPCYLLVFFL